MKYIEISNCCKKCMGCNLLELSWFNGKEKCKNYCKADDTGLEKCMRILRGDQITYEQIQKRKCNDRNNKV